MKCDFVIMGILTFFDSLRRDNEQLVAWGVH
jgi:hypothetical protein